MTRILRPLGLLGVAGTILLSSVRAETYHRLEVRDLKFEQDREIVAEVIEQVAWGTLAGTESAALRFPQEAYLAFLDGNRDAPRRDGVEAIGTCKVAFRIEGDAPLHGVFDVRPVDDGEVVSLPFTLDPATAKTCSRDEFEEVKRAHYARLLRDRGIPGTAWFRHQAGDLAARRQARDPDRDLDSTFEVFTGARAISENLALDRDLLVAPGQPDELVALDGIKGVTVKPINWARRLPQEAVPVDPLSLQIPHDQHAVFFPSLAGMRNLLALLESEGSLLLQAYSSRSPFRTLPSTYATQLGLDLTADEAARLPAKHVALTGGDPFFPSGTDVAILFETDTPEELFEALLVLITTKAATHGATPTPWQPDRVDAHRGFETPGRDFSAHLLRRGDLVAVANSPAQLTRLLEVGATQPSLGASEEFRFFRHRYPLGADESAFVFLSDATLRRWAGPETRIGASRRARALAALTELNARSLDGAPLGDEFGDLLGEVTTHRRKIHSARHGSVQFLTPVSELGLTTVTRAEADAYERWRTGYERGWPFVFDPIALRVAITKDTRKLDLTVLPLTAGSEYEKLIATVGEASLTPMARTVPPESLLHLAIAIDRNSELFKEFDQELPGLLPGLKVNPLGWVGESISLDLQDGFFWKAFEEAGMESGMELGMLLHAPVVVRVESTSRLKLAAFLTGLRAAVEASAPELVRWETRKHGKQSYVVVSGDEGELPSEVTIYYAAMAKALLVSLDEEVLARAIDRELAGPAKEGTVPAHEARQVLFESRTGFLLGFGRLTDGLDFEDRRRHESWRALPILNDWHRRFPNLDPVALHREAFGSDLFCPGGKGYRWNEVALTMESVAYGFPAAPRNEPVGLPILATMNTLRAGLEFAEGGLQAHLATGPAPAPAPAPEPTPGAKPLATAAALTLQHPGAVLKYRVTDNDGELIVTDRIMEVTPGEGFVTIVTKSESEREGEKNLSTSTQRLAGDLTRVSEVGSTTGLGALDRGGEPVPPRPNYVPPACGQEQDDPELPPRPTRPTYLIAEPIPDRPGFVRNPFTQNVVDARGIPEGTLIRDPLDPDPSHKFRIPGPAKPDREGPPPVPAPEPAPEKPVPPEEEKPMEWATTYDTPFVILPAKLIAGTSKTYPYSGHSRYGPDEDDQEREFGEVRIKVIGLEPVKVPAGTFEDAIRIESSGQALSGSAYLAWREVAWYATGVGLIKGESTSGGWRESTELIEITR